MSYGNRGMGLERMIEMTNTTYENKGIAIIKKRPTPMKVIGKSKRPGQHIAIFEKRSTVDYTGIYKGRAIEFEAKSTRLSTSWPIKDIHEHQVDHIRKVIEHGGIAFVIVEFASLEATYLLQGNRLLHVWQAAQKGARKSIPIDEFQMFCSEISSGRGVPLDYLAALEQEGQP